MNEGTEKFVREFGQQSYHKAVDFVVMAERFGDYKGAKMYADLAKELLQLGYHKYPKAEGGAK